MQRKKADNIYGKLKKVITNPVCELVHKNVFELLVSVMLSAQCTDKRVNIVIEKLFQKYSTPEDFAKANVHELEKMIQPCGFYQVKARNIQNASKKLIEHFNGQVPKTMDELLTLDGVGRKTASVVLAVGYNIPAIAVDTHVQRVSNRIGLCNTNDVLITERELKKLYDEKDWGNLHHVLLLFGRYHCKARNPECLTCMIQKDCKYFLEKNNKD